MKKTIILLVICFCVNYAFAEEIDNILAKNAEVILRVKCEEEAGIGICEKYCWQEVKVLKVLQNEGDYNFPDIIGIAYYSWEDGIPIGTSTIYLEKYNPSRDDLWKLVGGKAETGVSHYKK